MTARRVTRIEGAPEEAWLVTGDPLPPPSGRRWRSPREHWLWLHDRVMWLHQWTPFLDPTAATP